MSRDTPISSTEPSASAGTRGDSASRVETVDALRGIACLGVAMFHFVGAGAMLESESWASRTASYGWLGVQVFFVISGYIIPLSLLKRQYTWSDAGVFLAQRYVRVSIPYLVAAVVIVALAFASANYYEGFRGQPPHVPNWSAVGCHILYACDFTSIRWVNPVFWTLALEFQYYIAIAVLTPILVGPRYAIGWALVLCASIGSLFVPGWIVIAFAPLFVQGGLVLAHERRAISTAQLYAGLMVASATIWARSSVAEALAGLLAALAITHLRVTARWLCWIGTISYSIYLLHVPIGGRVVNYFAASTARTPMAFATIVAALAVTIVTSWFFYKVIESPCQKVSHRIRAERARKPSGTEECVAASNSP